jgi:hypothetical protein
MLVLMLKGVALREILHHTQLAARLRLGSSAV